MPGGTAAAPARRRMVLPEAEWEVLRGAAVAAAPEAFGADGDPLNLIGGEWGTPGHGKPALSPVDGRILGLLPMIDEEAGREAVAAAARQGPAWAATDLDVRRERVAATVQELRAHRDLLAYLLTWEIGKPVRQSRVEVDRMLDGVEWYVDEIRPMMGSREPIGLVSNIASWNYPLSVLGHAALVQVLCGNPVIAKTPTDGGLHTLTLTWAVAARHGLPVSLVSGSGGRLAEPLVRSEQVAALAFVGGKATGRAIASAVLERGKRLMLEMEGVNAMGIWDWSDWDTLEALIRKGFEYGKQRCTAYTRFVVQRELFPDFLEAYLEAVRGLRYGHPLLVEGPGEEAPDVDFGPLINSATVEELRDRYTEAVAAGAVMVHRGEFDESMFLPSQDVSAYMRPVALLGVPPSASLYHREPFGPVDSFVVVDRPEQLVSEMNVSNGALVGSVMCDDAEHAERIAAEVRAFKVGVNRLRSRGDREEPFGGLGESWKGCFVGGRYLVEAVTAGHPEARLAGNFPGGLTLPTPR